MLINDFPIVNAKTTTNLMFSQAATPKTKRIQVANGLASG